MDKKPYWLHILTETIGIPQIIAILIGVPTMTIFVWSIWQSLTLSHQIIAVTSGCAIMLVISLFIYGQTRKTLYVIPDLLYKMNSIVQNHAISINFITDLKEEDFFNAYRVIDIELANMLPSGTTLVERRAAMDTFYSQNKDRKISDEDVDKVSNYLMKKSGLLKKIRQDKEYIKVLGKINKLKMTIPKEDILKAINEFIRKSDSVNGLLPFCMIELPTIVPPKLEAVLIGISNNRDNEVAMSLTKVRESIEKYYKVGIK